MRNSGLTKLPLTSACLFLCACFQNDLVNIKPVDPETPALKAMSLVQFVSFRGVSSLYPLELLPNFNPDTLNYTTKAYKAWDLQLYLQPESDSFKITVIFNDSTVVKRTDAVGKVFYQGKHDSLSELHTTILDSLKNTRRTYKIKVSPF